MLFERFLNPDRINMPDIDIDFDDDGRGNVFRYVENKYGKDHISHVATFGTMAAKSAIKDVARIHQVPLAISDRLSKIIPSRPFEARVPDPEHEGKTKETTLPVTLPKRNSSLSSRISPSMSRTFGRSSIALSMPMYFSPL